MDALLKFLFESKKALITIFIAGALFYFGPRFAPEYVPKVPDFWAFAPLGVMTISGVLLLWLAVGVAGQLLVRAGVGLRKVAVSKHLSAHQVEVLLVLSQRSGYFIDLDDVPNSERLQVDLVCAELDEKGYTERSYIGAPIVSLTEAGKRRAKALMDTVKN